MIELNSIPQVPSQSSPNGAPLKEAADQGNLEPKIQAPEIRTTPLEPLPLPGEVRRQPEELTRRILEAVPGGIVQFSPEGGVLWSNQEAAKILGISADEMSRLCLEDFRSRTLKEESGRAVVHDFPAAECLRTGLPQPSQTLGILRPDGTTAWTIFTAIPLIPETSFTPWGVVATFVDISERKQAEQARREGERRFQALIENSSEGLAQIGMDGTIHYSSPGTTRILGYALRDFLGRNAFDLVHPEDLPSIQGLFQKLLEQPESTERAQFRCLHKDGSWRWIEGTGTNLLAEPSIGAIVVNSRDITDQKLAEDQMREYADRLQVLSRRLMATQEAERRHLACELHDEIGQLLTGLKLTLEMGIRSPLNAFRAPLSDAQALVHDLTARVRDLSLRLRPTMLDDLGLLPALLWHLERYMAQTGIRVDLHHTGLESRFSPEVETAAYRIVQEALTNVARHAQVKCVSVSLWAGSDDLTIQVEDRGIGFLAETVLAQGTSSGLVGMRERAILLGGQLVVEAAPGIGTCLTAELPLKSPAR